MDVLEKDIVDELLAIEDFGEQKTFLARHAQTFTEHHFRALKMAADHYLRARLEKSRHIAHLLFYLAECTHDEIPRALGLLVQANACAVGGLGEYEEAVNLYDQAADIYGACNRPLEQARSQIGKVFALTHLGQTQAAERAAGWAREILEAHQEWTPLSRLVSNLGIMYDRQGDNVQALAMFDLAREYCLRADNSEEDPFLPNVEHNRSMALRDLGRIDEAIEASQRARQLLLQMGLTVDAARALQSLATTYFLLGKYNEALAHLDQVKAEFLADGRIRDAMRVELYMTDCLLQLRRFPAVLEKCRDIRRHFSEKGVHYEVAQTLLFEAIAFTGLAAYDEAIRVLDEAEDLFAAEGNRTGIAHIHLQKASILYFQAQYAESETLALSGARTFAELEKPVEEAHARLAAARSLLARGAMDGVFDQIRRVAALKAVQEIPSVSYQCHSLQGAIAAHQGETDQALRHYDQAIETLEYLRSRLMLEFRANYVEDKGTVYESAVLLCLETDQPLRALDYVEQAKSRALVDLLAHRLDLRVKARAPEDQPLLDQLLQLRAERDRLYRRWEGSDEDREFDLTAASPFPTGVQQSLVTIEKQITELWHTILIRNADYASDAALWRSRAEPIQPLLAPETALVEYFIANGEWIVFFVTRDQVHTRRLAVGVRALQQQLQLLRFNMTAVTKASTSAQVAHMTTSIGQLLEHLYQQIFEPVRELATGFRHLVVVPHASLHYLPFHALRHAGRYLLEDYEFSYLPSASVLHYCRRDVTGSTLVAFGHSYAGRLPHTLAEADAVAQWMHGKVYLEEQATKERLLDQAEQARILHFATHADFRADNPLFSGLALDDGWLTTLDVFDLKLAASLVTLSACQTGRSMIGGGDELLGLMRAFISAGASSLLLSHWPVEDASTARMMALFYDKLAEGWTKRAALRHAQCAMIRHVDSAEEAGAPFAHPYYWAPFFLVGDSGTL